ncbi:hypothetical protein V865_003204 [Kwoniella europaea PYCC6329]|uniref:Uncharacterized protein n=1 Tax=Kwoniella europaea PYCC6329 TaxID=1423913 RepID=A0AAX4KF48_9TREE
MASLLELEYQRATTDDERLSIIDECFTSGLISEGEKTKYTLRLVGLSSLGQGAGTKEEKISLIDQARREGFINDDKAEEDKRSLAE